jgi:hypothetical protein
MTFVVCAWIYEGHSAGQKIQILVMVARCVPSIDPLPILVSVHAQLTIPRRAIMDPSLRRRVTKSKALPCKFRNYCEIVTILGLGGAI